MELFTSNMTFTLIFPTHFLNTVIYSVSILIVMMCKILLYYSECFKDGLQWVFQRFMIAASWYVHTKSDISYVPVKILSVSPVFRTDGHWTTTLGSLWPVSQVQHRQGLTLCPCCASLTFPWRASVLPLRHVMLWDPLSTHMYAA